MSCPRCGATQPESSRVLSTICRKCGHYFQVETQPPKERGFRFPRLFRRRREDPKTSYLKPSLELAAEPRERPAIRKGPRVEPFYGEEEYIPGEEGDPALKWEDGEETAADLLLNPVEEPDGEFEEGEEEEEFGSGYEMVEVELSRHFRDPAGAPQLRPLMPKFPERTTVCYDCGAVLHIEEKPPFVVCHRCSVRVGLQDVEIRDHRRESVKTRGDLTIFRKASLSAPEIACETLRVYGKITGKIDCHGDAYFRSSGKVIGNVQCRHLFVHKVSDLTFIPGIRAETADIHGRITGDLICEGTVRISKTGAVIGDCIAPAIELESGGILSGQMRIARPDQELREEYDRRAEVARSEFLMRGIDEFEESARSAEEESAESDESV